LRRRRTRNGDYLALSLATGDVLQRAEQDRGASSAAK
jgi:hypothetical protein